MFNRHAALWGRPFHYCRVSAGAGRAAWRTHEPRAWCITSIVMGPGRGAAASFVCVSLHAIDAA